MWSRALGQACYQVIQMVAWGCLAASGDGAENGGLKTQ